MDKVFRIHCSQISKIMGAAKKAGELSVGCQTFLKEWYANDNEQIHSKYLDKGNLVEDENIDFAARVLGYGMALKNTVTLADEFMVGTCDVEFPDAILDVKSPWNNKTFLDNIGGIDKDYEWQLRGYMRLWRKPKALLFYGLLDTPEMEYITPEISYSHLPENKRWIAYQIDRDETIENMIITRVLECRKWLDLYDAEVTNSLGKIHLTNSGGITQ